MKGPLSNDLTSVSDLTLYKGGENLQDMHEKTHGNIFTTMCHLNHSFLIQNTSREDTAPP